MDFEFKLTYKLPSTCTDIDQVVNKLGEAGCTDALVGLGTAGQMGLEFVRESATAEEAVRSAVDDVKRALPEAKLIGASPDFAGLTACKWM